MADLLRYYPRDYDELEAITDISSVVNGTRVVIRGQIITPISEKITKRIKLYEFSVADATGMVRVQFFNTPYIKKQLKKGISIILVNR